MSMRMMTALVIATALLARTVQPALAGLRNTQSGIYQNAIPPNQIPKNMPNTTSGKKLPVFYGNYQDWYRYVNSRLLKGTKYRVIDFDTKLSYNVIRVGGSSHGDVEPATAADTRIMYQTLGNSWDNWRRRALIVIINNEPIAASLYGEPHGYETIPNNGMNGQVCIHFLNSKTHGSSRVDADHQYQVKRAAGKIK